MWKNNVQLFQMNPFVRNKAKGQSSLRVLLPCSLIFSSSVLASDPYFDRGVIRWSNPTEQWYQVQETVDWDSICDGPIDSCPITAAGIYKVHNGAAGGQWTIEVTGAQMEGVVGTASSGGSSSCETFVPLVTSPVAAGEESITLNPACTYMVQNNVSHAVTCESANLTSCSVAPGSYTVHNWNSTANRVTPLIVPAGTGSTSGSTAVTATILNGDFDDGLTHWTTNSSAVVVWLNDVDLALEATYIEQSFAVAPGSELVVSGFARPTAGGATANLVFEVTFDSGDTDMATNSVSGWLSTPTSYSETFTVPDAVNVATLRVSMDSNEQARFYSIDVTSSGGTGGTTGTVVASGAPTINSEIVNTIEGVDFNARHADHIDDLEFYYVRPDPYKTYGTVASMEGSPFTEPSTTTDWQVKPTEGNFRIECQWSHFAYDDPIVFHDDDPEAPDSRKRGRNKAHLHMFWGNTAVDWQTNLEDNTDGNYITAKGGSTCNGFGLNRSSYWMPALMVDEDQAVAPREIIVYYKSRTTPASAAEPRNMPWIWGKVERVASINDNAVEMPQGLQLITGYGKRPPETISSDTFGSGDHLDIRDQNIIAKNRYLNYRNAIWGGVQDGVPGLGHSDTAGTISPFIFWGCGLNGHPRKKFNRIPTLHEWGQYCGEFDYNKKARDEQLAVADDPTRSAEDRASAQLNADGLVYLPAYPDLEATIYFPQCRSTESDTDGLRSLNFRDHVRHAETHQGCPIQFPYRMPQLGYRVYWDIKTVKDHADDGLDIDKLRLSSDPRPSEFELCNPDDVNRVRCDTDDTDGEVKVPGGTLHADWVSGWHEDVMELWIDNCNRRGANCTLGQTGTSLSLIRQPGDFEPLDADDYLLDTPYGSSRM